MKHTHSLPTNPVFAPTVAIIFLASLFTTPMSKAGKKSQPKLILDADTANEIDDLYAIVRTLRQDKFNVIGLTSAQWFHYLGKPDSVQASQKLNEDLVRLLNAGNLSTPMGAERPMGKPWGGEEPKDSPATQFIIKSALSMPEDEKLNVVCIGASTNLASAIKLKPEITSKIRAYLMGFKYERKTGVWNKSEFNVRRDLNAADFLLNQKNLELHVMTATASSILKFDRDESFRRQAEMGELGQFLTQRWETLFPDATKWTMWDVAVIEAILNPDLAQEEEVMTPPENVQRKVWIYHTIDTNRMRADFWKTLMENSKKQGSNGAFGKHSALSMKGWTIHLNDQLKRDKSKEVGVMLNILNEQLDRVIEAIPEQAVKHLRTVPIWINPTYKDKRPGAAYHPNINWLRENDRNPNMAKAIEITNVSIFPFENKRMPYLMLHELAHAYHDRVLGFDQPEIRKAFERARDSKGYDKVKRFNGKKIVMDKAYAMSNHKEYFAENTEAYFGKNDFFPFNRKELKKHDPEMSDLIAKAWGVTGIQVSTTAAKQNPPTPLSNLSWKAASSPSATSPPSIGGGAKAPVIFHNNRTTPVTVCWVDFKGKKAQQFSISPGSRKRRLTYAGHAWLVTDNKGASLGHFIATDTPAWADIPVIPLPSHEGNETNAALYPVTSPPPELGLTPFYQKCLNLDGFPILASGKVSDYALREAAYLIQMMLANRPDVLKALAASGARFTVMAHDEFTTDVPEHSHMGKQSKDKTSDWWDRRARGLGGSETDPVASCGEENLLCFPGDPYSKENILIHEFAHMIHLRGIKRTDPSFDIRLEKVWKDAMDAGLWKDKYSSTNSREYFAEGVQSWFNNNRENDHDHNHVNTRKELTDYDPALASLLKEVFGDTQLVYVRPPERKMQAHLKGYDYSLSPTFEWPERLKKLDKATKTR